MTKKLIVGNWKMNGSLAANAELLDAVLAGLAGCPSAAEAAVCASTPYLAQLQARLQGSALDWGAQDCSAHEAGAYTGEVSAPMLREFGCRYVIAGHDIFKLSHQLVKLVFQINNTVF